MQGVNHLCKICHIRTKTNIRPRHERQKHLEHRFADGDKYIAERASGNTDEI